MFQNLQRNRDMQTVAGGWFSESPRTWRCVPIRAVLSERNAPNAYNGEKQYLSLMAKKGVIPYEEKGNVGNKKPEDLSKCKIVESGDFVLNSMNFQIGSYGRSRYNGVCSSVYIVLRALLGSQPEYLDIVLAQNRLQQYAQMFGNGILDHRRAISWDTLKNLALPLPPAEEQSAIVKYLAHANARIDKAIATKRRLIALLEEEKRAYIDALVGTNEDCGQSGEGALSFDGGAELVPLKRLVVGRLRYGANESGDGGDRSLPRYIRITDFGGDGRLREDTYASVSVDVAHKYKVEAGDVLLARSGATVGKSFLVPRGLGLACHAGYLIRARVDQKKLLPEFLYLYTKSSSFEAWRSEALIQATIENISAEVYGSLAVPVPSLRVQRRIVEDAQSGARKTDGLCVRASRELELLEEFRTRLVADVVTGQVDVRKMAASLPEMDPEATPEELADAADADELDEAIDALDVKASA